MEIWFALLIPLIVLLVFYRIRKNELTFIESLIPFAVGIILILIFKGCGQSSLTKAYEYYGNYIVKAEHYEDWDEWITKTCTREYPCGTDKDGNTEYCTETYDCSYRDYHPDRYIAYLNDGSSLNISESQYNYYEKKLGGSPIFVDMHRDYYTQDGDMYYVDYNNKYENFEFYASKHTYKNKLQCSKSVFNYPDVTETEKKLYRLIDYPEVTNNELDAIIYKEDTTLLNKAKDKTNIKELSKIATVIPVEAYKRFDWINGMLGMSKQVRVWVLIWRNMPEKTGELQESYWKNGQKNELVVCFNIDNDKKVTWNHVFTWSESYDLKIDIRNYFVENDSLDLVSFGKWLYPEIESKWKRKEFKDFDYLTVPVPMWAIITTFIVVLIFSVGIYLWAGYNEFRPESLGKFNLSKSFNQMIEWIKKIWFSFAEWLKSLFKRDNFWKE
jgi:hypothetical protein